MEITAIPDRLARLEERLKLRGIGTCRAQLWISPHETRGYTIYMSWSYLEKYERYMPSDTETSKCLYGDTAEAAFNAADDYIDDLPLEADFVQQLFMKQMAGAIEFGKMADIPTDFINPLEAMMRKLSANALTAEQSK